MLEAFAQDRLDALVAEGVQGLSPSAGRLQTLVAKAFTQAKDAEAGAGSLLRKMAALQDLPNDTGSGWTGLFGLPNDPLGRPLDIFTVRASPPLL